MSGNDNLPHLLRMLDDDSPVVREALLRELGAEGPGLEARIARMDLHLSSEHWRRLAELRAEARRENLILQWPWCFQLPEEGHLESAHALLSEYIEARPRNGHLSELLDDLAEGFVESRATRDPYELAMYLFEECGLRGEHADYYAPLNSSLCHVIEQRRGNPISLCCIYMLVGRRLELDVRGINLPGHFLAQAALGGERLIVDCFNGARFMSVTAFQEMAKGHIHPDHYLDEPVTARHIMHRVLNNLVHAYSIVEDAENMDLMRRLQEAMTLDD